MEKQQILIRLNKISIRFRCVVMFGRYSNLSGYVLHFTNVLRKSIPGSGKPPNCLKLAQILAANIVNHRRVLEREYHKV